MDIIKKIKQLPKKNGVYLFKDKQNNIIYIGKAISLQDRVNSYFNKNYSHSIKISRLIKQIYDVEYILTSSEMEALLLESSLVKKEKPYFNTQLKDDKSYPFIQIDKKNIYPSIRVIRKSNKNIPTEDYYYGPFVDVEMVKNSVKKLREIFKIRNCTQRKFNQKKACLDFQLGLCSAPCADKISEEDYQKKVRECRMLLTGQHKRLLTEMKNEMKIASQLMLYEKAAATRDSIIMIEKLITQEKISKYYKKRQKYYISQKKENFFSIKTLTDIQAFLGLKNTPLHIEAFDISNISGDIPVGSMVVFNSGAPEKKKYRHYKIKNVKGINDFAMMKEVIYRRFKDVLEKKEKMPDLLLIDGGKGQLSSVLEILHDLNIDLDIISLAKREEEIFIPGNKEPFLLPEDSEMLYLIQRIRDEAHRFAVTFHKKLREKLIKKSVIDFIPGIGEKKKMMLLKKFKSVNAIKIAQINELTEIPGIGKNTAVKIKTVLEARDDFKLSE